MGLPSQAGAWAAEGGSLGDEAGPGSAKPRRSRQKRPLRFHKLQPDSGVIRCQTFADNVTALSRFLLAARPPRGAE